MSGKPLKLLSLSCVDYVLRLGAKRVMGGGGITHLSDAQEYLNAGCTHVTVASVLFNPLNWNRVKKMAVLLAS